MLKSELEQEVKRLRSILENIEYYYKDLGPLKKAGIQKIFDNNYDPQKPHSIYDVIGKSAAYVLEGVL